MTLKILSTLFPDVYKEQSIVIYLLDIKELDPTLLIWPPINIAKF